MDALLAPYAGGRGPTGADKLIRATHLLRTEAKSHA